MQNETPASGYALKSNGDPINWADEIARLESIINNLNNAIDTLCNCFVVSTLEQNQINKGLLFTSPGRIIPELGHGEKIITRIVAPKEKYAYIKGLTVSSEGATCNYNS